MKLSEAVEKRIRKYLGCVADNLKGCPDDEKKDILSGVESHLYEALAARSNSPGIEEFEAVLVEMDPPEAYNRTVDAGEKKGSRWRKYFFGTAVALGLVVVLVGFVVHTLMFSDIQTKPPSRHPKNAPNNQREYTASDPAPFVDDARVVGRWVSVDFVAVPERFDPDNRTCLDDLYLKDLTFLPQGRMAQPWYTWTSNEVFHLGDKTVSRYKIEEINGSEYLFFEWVNGDVLFRGREPYYYVLKRSNPGEKEAVPLPVISYTEFPKELAWCALEYIPPDFERFFPDDEAAGRRLDKLYDQQNTLELSDEELLEAVRRGLRRTSQHRTLILRWIGNRYIWAKSPQNPQAVEIMYHAAQPDNAYGTRHYAVYFGLSVLKEKTPNVLHTMTDICLCGEDNGRILWGLGKNKEALRPYLLPYLNDTNSSKHTTAVALNEAINGNLDMEKWVRERRADAARHNRKGMQ